jgi:hypothetical protein
MAKKNETAGALAPATLEEALAALATEQAKNAALEAELKDAAKVVAELKEKLTDGKTTELTVKVGNKKYAVVGGFKKNGVLFTKEAIAADAKLAEELLAKGSQLLIEIQ